MKKMIENVRNSYPSGWKIMEGIKKVCNSKSSILYGIYISMYRGKYICDESKSPSESNDPMC